MIKKLVLFLLLLSFTGHAYRLEPDQFYVSGGFGAQVNVVRSTAFDRASPKASLPLLVNLDYILDPTISLFGGFMPHFGAGNVTFAFRGGAKYNFIILDAPYVPYVSLALTPSWMVPMGPWPTHFNLGLSPGGGLNFFVLAKLLVGAHVHFNPSIAFIDGHKQFELSLMTYFDVTLRL